MSNYWSLLILLGCVIIIALAIYAAKLLKQLKQQRAAQEQQKNDIIKQHQLHDSKALSSVEIIIRAMKEEQCDLSEGSWRICVLLSSLKLNSALEQQFPSVFSLYEQIKHMPILEERKKLEKRERMKLDLDRMKAEVALKDSIHKELEALQTFTLARLKELQPNNSTS